MMYKWYKTVSFCKVCYYFFFLERCQHPVIPQNAWLIGNNSAHGGDVRIVCKFLQRSWKITCNDGVWSDPLLSCEGKDPFVNVD